MNKLDVLVGRSEIDQRYDCRSRLFKGLFLYWFDRVTKRVPKKPYGFFCCEPKLLSYPNNPEPALFPVTTLERVAAEIYGGLVSAHMGELVIGRQGLFPKRPVHWRRLPRRRREYLIGGGGARN